MGILNVTPDSFSDGGQFNEPSAAIQRAFLMRDAGADMIDIGGESTRPGALPVETADQLARVLPVIKGIRATEQRESIKVRLPISVDTTRYEVARAALDAGADWINDISAGEDDTRILKLAAERDVPIVLMHRSGQSAVMQDNTHYDDVCTEVVDYLATRARQAIDTGIKAEQLVLDPGIGFGKLLEHNLSLLAHLDALVALGFPVLLGTSRKRFIGDITDQPDPKQRVAGTCATTALGVAAGVSLFRVHDVAENRQAADVAWQIVSARQPSALGSHER